MDGATTTAEAIAAALFSAIAAEEARGFFEHAGYRPSDEPIGLGTIIQRRNSRSGTPVEGSMEVVEYEPDRAFGVVIQERTMETHGRATFEEAGEGRTRLTVAADMPIDESMKDRITGLMQRSVQHIKELIEGET